MLRILRPDRFSMGLELLKNYVSKDSFEIKENVIFNHIALIKNSKDEYIICLTNPGYDITDQLLSVAKDKNVKLNIVSLGKKQNQENATRKITESLRKGEYVALFNGHLDVEYLKKLNIIVGQNANSNETFRLFVVCEMSDTLPLSLLKNNHKLVFEKAIGIREALDRAFNTILSKDNIEITYEFKDLRLPFIFTWIHTIITERNRFRPYGWAEDYEFNENDLLSTIKSYSE